jgi:predicted small lipoprotein YifL
MRTAHRSATVLAALAVALAACGGGGDPVGTTATPSGDASPSQSAAQSVAEGDDDASGASEEAAQDILADLDPDLVLAAAVAQGQSLSARTAFSSSSSTPGGQVDVIGEGVVSGAGAFQFVITLDGASAVGLPGDGPAEVEVRLVEGVIYQRVPGLGAELGSDATWIAFDLASLRDQFAGQFDALVEQAEAGDPVAAFGALRDATSVTERGREEVNGVQATRYEVLVDRAALLEQEGLSESDLGPLDGLADELPVLVWIDDDGLLRRVTTEVTTEEFGSTTTFDVLEYGVDVDVEAPPADDTVSFRDLLGQFVPQS